MRGSHSGERIARVVLHILDRVGITVEVCSCSSATAHANNCLGGSLDPRQCGEQCDIYESA
jgi:hypothetical protein